ncbi:hypothetical protein D5F51_22195 [Yersinia hibernica]|uniref:Uncharacterized protein n=1 Tax=Yersinia hibernica TaxID=2339259 RepID=A0ABX5R6P0_9GAMM|nr:hypothetical protein D5F51_22195 [Yersinia hibernica]
MTFDENNLFICELNCTESDNEYSCQLSIYRDEIEQSLCFALSGKNELPTVISGDFLTHLCEQALQPLNSGLGIGIFPGSRLLTVFKKVSLAGYYQGSLNQLLSELMTSIEEWDSRLITA